MCVEKLFFVQMQYDFFHMKYLFVIVLFLLMSFRCDIIVKLQKGEEKKKKEKEEKTLKDTSFWLSYHRFAHH